MDHRIPLFILLGSLGVVLVSNSRKGEFLEESILVLDVSIIGSLVVLLLDALEAERFLIVLRVVHKRAARIAPVVVSIASLAQLGQELVLLQVLG